MECVFVLVVLLGLVFISTGVLYYRRPDIQWRVQQWNLELVGGIRAEQGENWGCWSRVGALTIIATGLFMLVLAASSYSDVQRSDATRSAYLTAVRAPRAVTGTARGEQADIATLEAIFAPLLPTLRARAQAALGDILLLPDAERRRYGLEDNPVYFGICGHNYRFYVIVANWGPAQAKYQYGNAVSATFPRTGCGSWLADSSANRWGPIPADSFDYEAELQETRSAAP